MSIILPTVLRERQEFPTPLFKLAAPLLVAAVAAIAALAAYLIVY